MTTKYPSKRSANFSLFVRTVFDKLNFLIHISTVAMPKKAANADLRNRQDFTYKYLNLGIENNKVYPIKRHEFIKPTAAIALKRSIVLT